MTLSHIPRTIHVTPAKAGSIVRDPATNQPLPAEGAEVPETVFWIRRVMAGDVVRTGEPKTPEAGQGGESKES